MLEREISDSGWQVTLRAKGIVRFFPAAFLALWLCGWAVGEVFAGGLMLALIGHAAGQSQWASWLPVMKGVPPEPQMQLLFFAFIAFWLTFWTIGGVSAFGQMLGLLFGREVIRFEGDTLEVRHVALVTLRRLRLEAADIRTIRKDRMTIVAETRHKRHAIATFCGKDERDELMTLLAEWHRARRRVVAASADESPAEGFRLEPDETGRVALVTGTRFQRGLGLVLLVIGVGCAFAASAIADRGDSPGRWGGVLIAGLFGTFFTYAGGWLTFVRESWHPRSGSLELRRHAFGQTWTTVFAPLTLELEASTDSDHDSRWTLVLRGEGQRRNLLSSTHDPNPPRALGEWLAGATGVTLTEKGQPSRFERAS
jgi:hypothetical protein